MVCLYTLSVIRAGCEAANANRHDTANYDEPNLEAKFVSSHFQLRKATQFVPGVILPLHIADIIHTTFFFFFTFIVNACLLNLLVFNTRFCKFALMFTCLARTLSLVHLAVSS